MSSTSSSISPNKREMIRVSIWKPPEGEERLITLGDSIVPGWMKCRDIRIRLDLPAVELHNQISGQMGIQGVGCIGTEHFPSAWADYQVLCKALGVPYQQKGPAVCTPSGPSGMRNSRSENLA